MRRTRRKCGRWWNIWLLRNWEADTRPRHSKYLVGKLRGLRLKPIVKGKKEIGYYQDFTYGKDVQRTTHNIIAVLPGKDRHLRNEYIVIGSHYDYAL